MARPGNVVVAGTFNCIHDGHRRLLSIAFNSGEQVFVGLTSDEFARRLKGECLPFAKRKKALARELAKFGKNWEIVEIEDEIGFTDEVEELDAIVASEETGKNAELVNKVRASNGMKPLEVIVIPLVKDGAGRKLSCRNMAKEK